MPDPVVIAAPKPAAAPPAQPNGATAPQTPPVAAAPPATPAAPTEPQADPRVLREQFQKLVQREKAILAEKQKLAEERKTLEDSRSADKAEREEAQKLKRWREGAKTDPESYLKPLFGDNWYDTLTEFRLNNKAPPDLRVDALRDELEGMKRAQAERETKATEEAKTRAAEEQREAIQTFNRRTVEHVKAAGEKYELINLVNYHEHVPELIEMHYRQQGNVPPEERKLLSVDEAAQMVEDWLAQQWEAMGRSKRLAGKLTQQPSAATAHDRKAPEGTTREARTLDNGLVATSARPAPALDEAERTRRAYAAFDAAIAAKRKQ